MKILVAGAGGQLGWELGRVGIPTDWNLTGLTRSQLDLTDRNSVDAALSRLQPDVVVNAAAYTAVDRAETEIEAALAANRDGPANLARACAERNMALIHVSTDYVFDGSQTWPYREDDPIKPLGAYGRSKAAGETEIRACLQRHVIIRTSWLYSAHGHNFVKTILRLASQRELLQVVADQHGGPTWAADLARGVIKVIATIGAGATDWGTYHFANRGRTTWHGFAEKIVEIATRYRPLAVREIRPLTTEQYPTPARRPANSLLDTAKFTSVFDFSIPPWEESLARMLAALLTDPAWEP